MISLCLRLTMNIDAKRKDMEVIWTCPAVSPYPRLKTNLCGCIITYDMRDRMIETNSWYLQSSEG